MNKFFISLILLISFYGCQKKDSNNPGSADPVISNAYFPMEVGNYWVFSFVNKSPDGSILGNSSIDTLKIISDTIILGERFFIFHTNKPNPDTQFMRRDSSGYIIDQNGDIKLLPSSNEALYNFHYGFIASDTAYAYWEEFHDGIITSFQSNDFSCLGRLAKHQTWPEFGSQIRIDSNLYASFGPLLRSYSYLSSGVKIYGILEDYHLEE
jgi:hypothetical protein